MALTWHGMAVSSDGGLLAVHFQQRRRHDLACVVEKRQSCPVGSLAVSLPCKTVEIQPNWPGQLIHVGALERHFESTERPVLLLTPTNSHTPGPMRSVAFVASSEYVMIGVDSMASDYFFGDRGASFDAAALVALAPADAPQIEVADGIEHAPTHQDAVPLRVRGYGKYSGSDRTIELLNAKLVPGFPSYQRPVSSGRLEYDNTINGV